MLVELPGEHPLCRDDVQSVWLLRRPKRPRVCQPTAQSPPLSCLAAHRHHPGPPQPLGAAWSPPWSFPSACRRPPGLGYNYPVPGQHAVKAVTAGTVAAATAAMTAAAAAAAAAAAVVTAVSAATARTVAAAATAAMTAAAAAATAAAVTMAVAAAVTMTAAATAAVTAAVVAAAAAAAVIAVVAAAVARTVAAVAAAVESSPRPRNTKHTEPTPQKP